MEIKNEAQKEESKVTCNQEKCPLHGKRIVPSSRSIKDSYLVVLGEAPGRVEERQGKPFVGQSGQLLRKVLKTMGLNTEEICYTNVVHCRPPDNSTPSNDTCRLCMAEHKEEWDELYKDKVVLVVGGTAAWAVCGARSVGSVRGSTKKIGTSIFLFVWHPAYVVRNPKAIYQWTKEMQGILKLLERGESQRDKIPFTMIQNMRQLQEFVERAKNTEMFSFDLETTGLDSLAEGARILCLSVATRDECVVIPLQHKNAPVWGNGVVRELKALFSGSAKKVGINVKFDMLWLKVIYGIDVANIYFDPQTAQHLLNEGVFTPIALEQLVWKYLPDEGGYKESLVGKDYDKLEELDEDIFYRYSALDSIFALKLVDKIEPQIREKGMEFLYFNIVNPTISTLVEMEYNGFQVDFDTVKFQHRQMAQKIETLEVRLRADSQILDEEREKFSFNSLPQLKKVLIDRYNMPIISTTAKGQPQLTAEILQNYGNRGCEFAVRLLEYRKAMKVENTYLKNIEKKNVRGLIHSNYGLYTAGGRLNSSNMAMQNLPRGVRDCFTSRFDGGKLVDLDFSQTEMRVCAYCTKDENLAELFRRGVDVHAEMAAKMKTLTDSSGKVWRSEEVTKEERQAAKGMNFGLIYGRSAYSISDELGVPLSVAERFSGAFFGEFKRVGGFHLEVRAKIRQGEYTISNYFGRRRNLDGFEEKDALRRAYNFPIQSLSSDLNLLVLNDLQHYLKENNMKSRIVATVHDSVTIDAPADEVDEVVALMKQAPENLDFPWMTFPLEVDISVGTHWGSLSPVEVINA